jgi:hypothetical protein
MDSVTPGEPREGAGAVAATLLTQRDLYILEILTQRVRVMSVAQVARVFWPTAEDSVVSAEARLRALDKSGHVELFTITAHPELPLGEPVTTWQVGLPTPDFAAVSTAVRSRWTQPERATLVVGATAQAGRELAGHGGRRPRTSEGTHDLHLAAVYLEMRRNLPTRARTWRSEASIVAVRNKSARAQKLPDAMVRDGRSQTAIEFGGAYDADKLAAFHSHCEKNSFGYEVW